MSVTHIKQDILDSTADYICHQCNCVSNNSKGLSKAIFDMFPEANDYEKRKENGKRDIPGTIAIYDRVINMFAQYYPGRPKYQNDTWVLRIQHFQSCLDRIAELDFESIAFPKNIGCGLAGGDWNIYEEMIINFTMHKNCKTYICEK